LEVVEDEQEQAPEIAAEFYPASANGSSGIERAELSPPSLATAASVPQAPAAEQSSAQTNGGNGSAKSPVNGTASPTVGNNGNGSRGSSGFNQLRNEFLTAARRVATTKKQAIGEVVEWASGGSFKYGDIGRMTEGDVPKLRAATELMASTLTGTTR